MNSYFPSLKLVPVVTDWAPESDEDKERLLRMLRLSAAALKVRDGDATSARNAEQVGVPDRLENDQFYISLCSEISGNINMPQDAVKESKELRKKVKKLEKRSARDGDTDAIMTVRFPAA